MAKRVSGINKVINNLNTEIKKIEGKTLKGLIRAAIQIAYDMGKTSPTVPIHTGNLRASRFIVTSKGGTPEGKSPVFKRENSGKLASGHNSMVVSSQMAAKAAGQPTVIIGFSAWYAWKVHEMVGAHFREEGSGAKFFEAAIKRNTNKALKIIAEEAKIK